MSDIKPPNGGARDFQLGQIVSSLESLSTGLEQVRQTTVTKDYMQATLAPIQRLMWIVITAVVGVIIALVATAIIRSNLSGPVITPPTVNVIVPTAAPVKSP